MPVVIVLLVLIILAELFRLMLRCRRGIPAGSLLRQYRYAHRGYHDKPHIPENSMAAFRRAIEHGYGAGAGRPSDEGRPLGGDPRRQSQAHRRGGCSGGGPDGGGAEEYRLEGTQEQIPLLEEVLPLFQGKTPLIIELKAGGATTPIGRGHLHHVGPVPGELLHRVLRPPVHPVAEKDIGLSSSGASCRSSSCATGSPADTEGYHVAAGESADQRGHQPDFIAYRFSDRENLCLRLCHKVYHVQEVNWTIRAKEEMEAAEAQGNLVIFECFDPEV